MMARPIRNPNHLPTKICPVCQRPFTWRKKWERNWENVRYCSDQCRHAADSRNKRSSSTS